MNLSISNPKKPPRSNRPMPVNKFVSSDLQTTSALCRAFVNKPSRSCFGVIS